MFGWVRRTGQSRLVVAAAAGVALAGVQLAGIAAGANGLFGVTSDDVAVACGVALPLALALVVYGVVGVKCSLCKARPIVMSVRRANVSEWVFEVLAMERCPKCGDDGKIRARGLR